ncbi:A disintegrin and metalloproteinase with thrombospondin motifs 12 [Diachasma alloeum]|uniref:A disintegrin and metalloproteinase with thrombospondin motifs 12 n=1 Tax=Diachasma alloeum TaxID=454923 RepID=UPI000738258E|nr:A disintegrin and metalloproteinase with thrombospondin motifs 12 [Diachasma alloeum]
MLTFIVLFFSSVVAIQSERLHDRMTDEEIQSVFHVPRDQVPDYEVVPIQTLLRKNNERADRITMIMSNEHIDAYLDPTEGFLVGETTPVLLAKPNKKFASGVEYIPVKNALENVMLYKNPADRMNLVVKKQLNRFNIYGKIKDYVIRPIPRRLKPESAGLLGILFGDPQNQILRFGSSYGNDSINELHHIVYSAASLKVDHPQNSTVPSNPMQRSPRASRESIVPSVIFPEVLVVMDNSLFKTQGNDVSSAILYLLSFWNAVDLRYRSMSDPKIRLNIAGLIISVEEGGTPYIDNYKFNSTDESIQVEADKALKHMSKYFYNESNLPNYDASIAMTGSDLCNMIDSPFFENFCNSETRGYAYLAGACNRSSVDQNTKAVGLIEDNGGFSGIIPAAHELAHLLGVPHDEGECASGRYIMTPQIQHSENSFLWSDCSKEAFREFFSSEDGTCLLNEPKAVRKAMRILPGTVQSLDQQCEKIYGRGVTKACQDDNICRSLQCQVPGRQFCRGIAAAAEGSICAPGKRCISGFCVSLQI